MIRGGDAAGIVGRAADPSEQDGAPLLSELGSRIATAVAAIEALLDPGLIVLGGPVSAAGGTTLLAAVSHALGRMVFTRPALALSTIGADGILAGAVAEALRDARARLFDRVEVPRGAVRIHVVVGGTAS